MLSVRTFFWPWQKLPRTRATSPARMRGSNILELLQAFDETPLNPQQRSDFMPWYELVKVVHFLGFTALIGFFIIYSRAGPKLRAATDVKEVRTWLGLLAVAQPMVPGGAGMLTVSGLIMAWMRWRGPY